MSKRKSVPLDDSQSLERQVYTDPRGRWLRLVRRISGFGGFYALFSLFGDYLWDFGFTSAGLEKDLMLWRVAKALANGLFFGIFMGSPIWLVQEHFGKPKKKTLTTQPGA